MFGLIDNLARLSRAVATLGAALAVALTLGLNAAAAFGDASPHWAIRSLAQPTIFAAGDNERCEAQSVCDSYSLRVTNVGGAASSGAPVIIRDSLPEHVAVSAIAAHDLARGELEEAFAEFLGLGKLECSVTPLQCTYPEHVPAGDSLQITIKVTVTDNTPAGVTNHAEVEGGGAGLATTGEPSTAPNLVNHEPSGFGLQDFSIGIYRPDGNTDVQAGDHPASLTTSFDLTSRIWGAANGEHAYIPVQDPKTITVDLPMGLIGDPTATPQCPEANLDLNTGGSGCPANTRIGTVVLNRMGQDEYSQRSRVLKIGSEEFQQPEPEVSDLYNMVPEPGHPATFGFRFIAAAVLMYARVVPTPRGYRVRVTVPDIPHVSSQLKVNGASLTFFGDPPERNGAAREHSAFLTNPTRCAGPVDLMSARMEATSWVNPGEAAVAEAPVYPQITGCNMLQFNPAIEVTPNVTQADTPSGYEIDLKVPQTPSLAPMLATPDLKDATVTLPEGVSLSPSAADGLEGCTEGQINLLGTETAVDGLEHAAHGDCPAKSEIGDVTIATPLLHEKLEGHLYVAAPKCGGEAQPECIEVSATNGELFGLYLEAEGAGVDIKLKGTVQADPHTGQLTTRFDENPQLPFSDLKLRIKGGARAPLANPQSCGPATATADLSPWSAPETPDASPSWSFNVDWDGNGGACPARPPFGPSFTAGTVNPIGGGFSPFTLTVSRQDREQDLGGVTVRTPPGLLGKIAEVKLCGEPQASQGLCGPHSLIGHTQVAAGAGSHPFWLSGSVYLTTSYKGASFGLSIVVPEKAGPFNLGNEVVRAAINVDPHTSALTVTSDPLPQHKDGVSFRLQTINVTIDRPNFTFNPTNCAQQQITGTIAGALPDGSPGSTVPVSTPFAVVGCKNLPFKPTFKVLTQAKTSKANGASLHVKVTSRPGQANIGKVKVDLPKQLPSRLTTLQKACRDATFNANPASCPAGSVVGAASAVTAVLKSPLTGPAYLVSHAGAAFPDLVIVLQGEGITLDLVGNTDIKKGVTISTFNSVPDAPISTFDLVLPEGPHSALAAYGNLCKSKLNMPTAITGQNGAVIKQTTRIAVAGCPKHKKARRARTHRHDRRARR